MGCTSSSPTDIAEAPKVKTHSPKHNTEPSENSLNHFPEASTLTQCSSSSTVTSSILPSSSSSNEHLFFCQPNAAAAAPATPSSRTNISTFAQQSQQQQQRDKQHDKKESSSNTQVAPSSSVVTRPEPPIPLRRAKSETGEHRRRLVKNKLSSSYRRLLECKFPTPAAAHAALGEEYVAWLRHLEALSNEYLSMPPCSSDDLSEVSVSTHSQQSNPPVLPSYSPDAGTRSARSVTVVSKSRFDCAVDPGLNVLHIQQHVASYLGILKLPPSTLVSSPPPAILSTPASTQYSDTRALSTDSLPSDLPPASDLCLPEAAISASIDVLQVDVPRSGDLEDDDDDDYEEDMRYDGREQKRNNNVEASPMYFAEHTPELPRFGGAYYT